MAGLRLIEAAAEEPISVELAKIDQRIGDDAEESLIELWIREGRAYVESRTHRALVTQRWRLSLDCWPGSRLIRLPRPPLVSVDLVQYRDTAGVMQTLASTEYQVDEEHEPALIKPAYGKTWPATQPGFNAVVVEYTAGYGNAEDVPPAAQSAILLHVGDAYAHRETIGTGTIAYQLAKTIDSTLANLLRPGADEEAL